MPTQELLDSLNKAEPTKCLVTDDLQLVQNETVQNRLLEMIGSGEYRMILLGRNATPAWLLPMVSAMKLLVIREEDLRLHEE